MPSTTAELQRCLMFSVLSLRFFFRFFVSLFFFSFIASVFRFIVLLCQYFVFTRRFSSYWFRFFFIACGAAPISSQCTDSSLIKRKTKRNEEAKNGAVSFFHVALLHLICPSSPGPVPFLPNCTSLYLLAAYPIHTIVRFAPPPLI